MEEKDNELLEQQAEESAADVSAETTESEDVDDFDEEIEELPVDAEPDAPQSEELAAPKPSFLKRVGNGLMAVWEKSGFAEFFLMRFIGAYMIVAAVNTWTLRFGRGVMISATDSWKEFVENSNFLSLMLWSAAGFMFLTFLYTILPKKWRLADPIALLGGTISFGVVMMWQDNGVYHSLGMCAIAIVFTIYAFSKFDVNRIENTPKWFAPTVVIISSIAVCAFVAIMTVCRNLVFSTATFDFGIFVQMYHSIVKDFTAVTTCERDALLSHFKVHASFIFYALAPVYKLFPSGNTLLIAQAVLAMGGVIPFYLILKNHKFKGIPLIAASFFYIFCAGVLAPCYYDFHENCFLPTLLMWLLYAIDRKKMVLFYIMSALTCIVKEDAPLYVFCIAMFFFFNEKSAKRLNGMIVTIISGLYFVNITNWLTKNGDGSTMAATRFGHLTIDQTAGFAGIVKNVLTDPAYFFSLLFTEESLLFFLQVMVPMLFLPFMTKKISRYLMMLPFIIMNLVIGANYGYACKIGFQYIFGPSCLLLYICVLNLEDMDKDKAKSYVAGGAVASIMMLTSNISGSTSYYKRYTGAKEHYDRMHAAMDKIPEDASVAATVWYQPYLANRDVVYLLDGQDLETDPNDENNKILLEPLRTDVVVLSDNDENTKFFRPDLERNGFKEYLHEDSVWIWLAPDYSIPEK